jgi:hypothetical protein
VAETAEFKWISSLTVHQHIWSSIGWPVAQVHATAAVCAVGPHTSRLIIALKCAKSFKLKEQAVESSCPFA